MNADVMYKSYAIFIL